MRRYAGVAAMACLGVLVAGCQGESDPEAGSPAQADSPAQVMAHDADDQHLTASDEQPAASEPPLPQGWSVFVPPEGDFSVMAPGQPVEAANRELKMWNVRRYTFGGGGGPVAPLVVELYSNRNGPLATDTVADLRASPDIVPGTLRDISLPGMPGIEFRTQGGAGEVVHREFCSPDLSSSITLFAQPDVGEGLSDVEVRAFLDSFKLLR